MGAYLGQARKPRRVRTALLAAAFVGALVVAHRAGRGALTGATPGRSGGVGESVAAAEPLPRVRVPEPAEEFAHWVERCSSVLFDLGANRGDTIERWYSGKPWVGRAAEKKGSSAARRKSLDEVVSPSQRASYCVVSFEPNRRFTETLKGIERKFSIEGKQVYVYTETVASDAFGETDIFVDETSTHGYGSSVFADKKVNFGGKLSSLGGSHRVRQVDLAALIRVVPDTTPVVLKMDIEGGEYPVLRQLLATGTLCRATVLIIEWHGHKIASKAWPSGVEKAIEWVLESEACGVTVVKDD